MNFRKLATPRVLLSLILVGTAIFYREAFFAPFFREDGTILKLHFPEDLLLTVGPHYHPISVQIFYFLSKNFFVSNYFLYHLVLFIFYSGGLLLLYQVASDLLKSKNKALFIIFLQGFNVSFFPIYYWIATSYYSIGFFFFSLTIYLFQQRKKTSLIFSVISFVLSLLSNEASLVLPGLLFLICWYQKGSFKRLAGFVLVDLVFLFFRFAILKIPTQSAYKMHFDLGFLKTLQWYILRALNLPEGVRFSADYSLLFFFLVILVFLGMLFLYRFRTKSINHRLLIFGAAWFLIGALPFYFLPDHISAYYLTFSFFGFAVILSEIISNQKIMILFGLVYILLSIRGLNFLSKTHWIILKNVGVNSKFYRIEDNRYEE